MELRPYQQEAVDFLHRKGSAALLLDMGLGKTAITLSALTPDHLPVLVTAPPRPAESVWPEETAKWRPDLTIVHASGKNRTAALDGTIPADIVVISREQLSHVKDRHVRRFRTFVLDELSGFKNNRTTRFKNARRITKDMPYVWGLTGTPASNGLLDLWAQMFLIDRGECLERTLGSYRSRYFTPGGQLPSGVVTSWNLRPGASSRIHERLKPRALSMGTDGRVSLPPLTENQITVELPTSARTVYRQMKEDLVTTALEAGTFTAGNAAGLSNRLRQIASGFLYADVDERLEDEFSVVHTEKLKALGELIDSAQGNPILLGYAYRPELKQIMEAFPQARQLHGHKDITDWNAGRIPLLVGHPASMGHGLNLQSGGHTLVWYGLTYSLEEYQQMNKRLFRSGQEKPVVIHHIVARGTVDTAIVRALAQKDSVQSALLQYLDPEGIL